MKLRKSKIELPMLIAIGLGGLAMLSLLLWLMYIIHLAAMHIWLGWLGYSGEVTVWAIVGVSLFIGLSPKPVNMILGNFSLGLAILSWIGVFA